MRVTRCRCGAIIQGNASKCQACEERAKKTRLTQSQIYDRGRVGERLYHTAVWQVVAKAVRARDLNLCVLCKDKHILTPAQMVHHIVPLEDSTELSLDKNNCISLCRSCHERVHSLYDRSIESKQLTQQKLKCLVPVVTDIIDV